MEHKENQLGQWRNLMVKNVIAAWMRSLLSYSWRTLTVLQIITEVHWTSERRTLCYLMFIGWNMSVLDAVFSSYELSIILETRLLLPVLISLFSAPLHETGLIPIWTHVHRTRTLPNHVSHEKSHLAFSSQCYNETLLCSSTPILLEWTYFSDILNINAEMFPIFLQIVPLY